MDLTDIAHRLANDPSGVEISAFFVVPPESNYEINNMKYWSDFGFSGKIQGQPFSLTGKIYFKPEFDIDYEHVSVKPNVESEPDLDKTTFDWGGKLHLKGVEWSDEAVDAFEMLINDRNFVAKWDSISKTAKDLFEDSEAHSDFLDIERTMAER